MYLLVLLSSFSLLSLNAGGLAVVYVFVVFDMYAYVAEIVDA